MSRIIDISQPLERGIAVWPGDTEFQPFWAATLEQTGSVNVGGVKMSLHTGTHADAPKHFRNDGLSPPPTSTWASTSAKRWCSTFSDIGETLRDGIAAEQIQTALGADRPERLLCRTGTVPAGIFPETFAHFTPDTARLLADYGVRLIGIDTPSVDRVDSKELGAHHIFADSGIAILGKPRARSCPRRTVRVDRPAAETGRHGLLPGPRGAAYAQLIEILSLILKATKKAGAFAPAFHLSAIEQSDYMFLMIAVANPEVPTFFAPFI